MGVVNNGTVANDGTGDTIRDGATKINQAFIDYVAGNIPDQTITEPKLDNNSVSTRTIAAAAVTNAKLANMVQATFKGRAAGAGTGAPTDLDRLNALAILAVPTTFDTRAAAIAATIPTATTNILLLGYTTAGDGGVSLWKRVTDSGALLAYQFRSNGGTVRWELDEARPNQFMLGAAGGFTGDDKPAFQALADYCADRNKVFSTVPGNHLIGSTILLRPGPVPDDNYNFYERGPYWRFDNNTVLRASASMNAIVQLNDHTYENIIRDGVLEGGQFDQNNLATRGVWATFVNKVTLRGGQSVNIPTNGCGVQVGTTTNNEFATLVPSYEGFVQDWRVIGTNHLADITARSGTTGIRFINCTDNQTRENVISGVIIGISGDFVSGWDGKHVANHFWNWSANGAMTYGFDLYGDNALIGNQQDGPFLYCARFQGPRNNVTGHKVNYGSQAADADNTAALWRLENDTTNSTFGGVTVTNSGFKGQPAKRLATELSLGSGCTRADFRKDGSNYYSNIITVEPVSIGNCLSGRVLVSGTTPTLQAGSNNVASVTRSGAGNYVVNFTRAVSIDIPITCQVITNGVFVNIVPVEDTTSRTTTAARFFFYNVSNTLTDPGGFVVSATSL